MLSGKRILLIISGGIAAYKALELIRRLRERGASVRCVLTQAASQFVTPLSVGALSGDQVYTDLFSLTDEASMGHIQLSRDADVLVVAPATADILARMCAGMANDLASTVLLATDKPVLVAPAMNVRMWLHPATQANIATLRQRGVRFVGPDDGDMACGEYGPGRLAEPLDILSAIETSLTAPAIPRPLAGLSALVTSGPTHEPIDPVRYIANHSSGKQGHAIAAALAQAGARVTLVSGPVSLPDPPGVTAVPVVTARQMQAACEAALPVDIAICAAAVADWGIDPAPEKLKKQPGGAPPPLVLVENPDILAGLSRHTTARPRLVVGFAAETERVLDHARAKRARKGCDWMLANDVSPDTGTFGGDANQVTVLSDAGEQAWPVLSKTAVAERLVAQIGTYFANEMKTKDKG